MTLHSVRVCRACDQIITEHETAVAVAHELGNSGPGYTIWAHPEHVDEVEIIDPKLLDFMLRLWAAGS